MSKSKKSESPAVIQKSKFQKFKIKSMLRSQICEAAYNPRILADSAGKKLKQKMKVVGLLQPIVVNRTTGNLVSGHQRLATLDSLERGKNYELDVSVIEVDERTEKEMVVFFNNPSAQGEWDLDKLAELNLSDEINFDDMGFDKFDIDMLFDGDSRFSDLFPESENVKKTGEKLKEIKEARSKGVDVMAGKNEAQFYFVVVCQDEKEKEELLKKIGMPTFEQFVPGHYLDESLINKFGAKNK